jgi:hypothetical protein
LNDNERGWFSAGALGRGNAQSVQMQERLPDQINPEKLIQNQG